MSNWNDLTRDRLIKEYRKYPCLWSNKDGDAKNAEKRKECLGKITAELNKCDEKPFTFTEEEVRTQFKNLRDMYRRKRKKLHFQKEVNPGASLDEPGWTYYSRLKFLDDVADFSPPNESPPPPPKKKPKVAAARPSADDASLPTPLEEGLTVDIDTASTKPTVDSESTSSATESEQQKTAETQNISPKIQQQELDRLNLLQQIKDETAPESPKPPAAERSRSRSRTNDDDDLTQQSNTQQATTQTASAEPCIQQQQQQQPVEAATCSTQQQGRTTSNSRESKATGGDESEDEFACFGRFVAMSLKKVSTRSPIGALEARKEISDVLYRAELNSLPH